MAAPGQQGSIERRLATILAADIARYSRLMGADKEWTLAQLKAHRRALVDPKITRAPRPDRQDNRGGHAGRVRERLDALRCADEVQRGFKCSANPGSIGTVR